MTATPFVTIDLAGQDLAPVDGVVAPVAGALTADLFLVPVTDDGGETSLRALGRDDVELEPITSLDMTRPLARVTVTGQGSEIATGDAARAAVDAGLAAGAALHRDAQARSGETVRGILAS